MSDLWEETVLTNRGGFVILRIDSGSFNWEKIEFFVVERTGRKEKISNG